MISLFMRRPSSVLWCTNTDKDHTERKPLDKSQSHIERERYRYCSLLVYLCCCIQPYRLAGLLGAGVRASAIVTITGAFTEAQLAGFSTVFFCSFVARQWLVDFLQRSSLGELAVLHILIIPKQYSIAKCNNCTYLLCKLINQCIYYSIIETITNYD